VSDRSDIAGTDPEPTDRLAELLAQIDAEWDDRSDELEGWCVEAASIAARLGEVGTRIGLVRRLAELAVADERPDDAYEALEPLLHVDDAPPLELGHVHSAIAHLARHIGNIDVGAHLNAAVELTTEADDSVRAIDVRFDLGEHLGSIGDNSGALQQFVEAQALARGIGDAILSARADDRIAAAHWELGRGDLAEEHLRRALAVARATGDDDRIAHAAYRLAWCLADHSPVEDEFEALELLSECIDHARDTGDLRRIAECDAMSARVHRANDDLDEAIRLLRSAIAIHESTGATTAAAIDRANLATDLEAVGHRSAAEHEYRRALELLGSDRFIAAKVTTRLAQLLCTLGRPAEALELLEAVTEYFDRSDDATESPRFHMAAARAHLDLGRTPHGRLHAQRALRCLAGALRPELHARVLELLAECDALEHDMDGASLKYGQAVALWFHADSIPDARRVARRVLPRPPTSEDEVDGADSRPVAPTGTPFIGMYL